MPILPIYGVGAVFILLVFKKLKKHPVILFICISLLMGLFEYINGYVIDIYLNKELWNYEHRLLNINGYVCLYSSLSFGVGGLLLLYLFEPFYNKIFNKINYKWIKLFTIFLLLVLIIDIFISYFFK